MKAFVLDYKYSQSVYNILCIILYIMYYIMIYYDDVMV